MLIGKTINSINHIVNITVCFTATVMLFLFSACSGSQKNLADAIVSRDSIPLMRTVGVETLISDSGVIRYKVIADEWTIFDRLDPPFWAFEKGVYLEQFDENLSKEATIEADTAYYYETKKLWKLRGNVHIENLKNEKFDTQLLFWDQGHEKVYSDKKIRIEQIDKVIIGQGFESNQQLTDYVIHNTEGVFYLDEEETISNDSLVQDSV